MWRTDGDSPSEAMPVLLSRLARLDNTNGTGAQSPGAQVRVHRLDANLCERPRPGRDGISKPSVSTLGTHATNPESRSRFAGAGTAHVRAHGLSASIHAIRGCFSAA